VTDHRLREFERRWKETGGVEDGAAWLWARVQAGELSEVRLGIAAFVDCEPAREALADRAPTAPSTVPGWADGLKAWGIESSYWRKNAAYDYRNNQITVWVPAECPRASPSRGRGHFALPSMKVEEPAQRLLLLKTVQDESALRPEANAELAKWVLSASCPSGISDYAHLATGKPLYLAHVVAALEAVKLSCRVLPSELYSGWDVPVWDDELPVGCFRIGRNGSYDPSPLRGSPRLKAIRDVIVQQLGPTGFLTAEERGLL